MEGVRRRVVDTSLLDRIKKQIHHALFCCLLLFGFSRTVEETRSRAQHRPCPDPPPHTPAQRQASNGGPSVQAMDAPVAYRRHSSGSLSGSVDNSRNGGGGGGGTSSRAAPTGGPAPPSISTAPSYRTAVTLLSDSRGGGTTAGDAGARYPSTGGTNGGGGGGRGGGGASSASLRPGWVVRYTADGKKCGCSCSAPMFIFPSAPMFIFPCARARMRVCVWRFRMPPIAMRRNMVIIDEPFEFRVEFRGFVQRVCTRLKQKKWAD